MKSWYMDWICDEVKKIPSLISSLGIQHLYIRVMMRAEANAEES